ncbi:MAG: FecR domain-containing protein, partial [Erythrobacteraceae bacterium]
MRALYRLLLPIALLLFSGVPALAQSGDWTIAEAKGSVLVIDSRGQRGAVNGVALEPGATVRTQAKSSAVLVRGREFVTLRQNAQIRIPEAARSRSIMQIIQDYGSALFNIGKQPDPHFGVETPYLAAVVKGTTFIIAVGIDGATLQVTEGAVEASTRDGGARELILPGAVAMIAANDPMRMVIEGETKRVIDSPARPASAPAASAPASFTAPAPAAQGNGPQRVDQVIASTPGDIGSYSGGFASGEIAVIAAAVVADNTLRGAGASAGSGSGAGGGSNGGGVSAGASQGNGGGPAGGQGSGGNGNGGGDAGGNANGGGGEGSGNGGGPGNGNGNGAGSGNGSSNGGEGSGNGNGNGNGGNAGGNGTGNGNGAGQG